MYILSATVTQETKSLFSLFTHSLVHALSHTWIIFPILFLVYFILMKLERTISTDKMLTSKVNSPISGSILGVIPQCGIGVVAADLFNRNKITAGTLLSVFISSSDEALMILLTGGEKVNQALGLIGIKMIIGMIVGFLFDKIYKNDLQERLSDDCVHKHHCECCQPDISPIKGALLHAIKITLCVFIVFVVFDFAISIVGREFVSSILLTDTYFQPLITAAIGLIPVCAISIILATLFLGGGLSFGSAIAGLISAAGFGLVVLARGNENPKLVIKIIFSLYIVASLAGVICEILL